MSTLIRQIIFCSFILLNIQTSEAHQTAEGTNPSRYVSAEAWQQVQPYLMPDDHPAKERLDQIFSTSRAFCDQKSMEAAGFDPAKPQHCSQIIVTRHPHLKEYVIKAYLDEQPYRKDRPEYYYWIARATGAQLIRQAIADHNYGHLFKVPQKWIYLLPDEPSPPPGYLRKMFILVEEDMEIFNDRINEKLWRSRWVTKERLKALYTIVTELGLFDCAKPSNCPFSKDGRNAFVDTQSYDKGFVRYEKLTPYLSSSMQQYWRKLIKQGKKKDQQGE
jgi:hypothetical protein